ncbi:hypothetical protein M422DRAFT_47955 [Sphaerobolus stellatus SS14]|uniref:DUF6533 domain-containing protein n=1 Tax=Sphaerobolus stellatus (strain SS14) TaxID=990650 RepID=A0A0C9VWV3_SPHS4|nr:hypothetical protein M422DRAFT_47955 [Sphaerobolus stellatus SS14]
MDGLEVQELITPYFYERVQSYADLAGPGIEQTTKKVMHHTQLTNTSQALLLYDTMLTLDKELKHIWKRKVNLGTILYLTARYFILDDMFSFWAYDLVSLEDNPSQRVLNTAAGTAIQAILIARAYSITGGNKILGITLLFMLMASLAISLRVLFIPFLGSVPGDVRTLDTVQVTLSLLIEFIVMAVTAYYAWSIRGSTFNASQDDQASLFHIFLRQGVMRFT